ncbi:LysR family transcriptional regulator [Cupriavidus sp. SK-3]|uniref:LysR family transcriptional regulator n=1 Tax=Cupriavidus sp. SK-3 TaxID=1470558 RepID=UPI0026924BD2
MGSLKRCDVDRLEDLLFFAEIVDHDGFSAAARNLGLQRSKLSRRIAWNSAWASACCSATPAKSTVP